MKLFDGCLLCCDIDGTLISNGVIPKENMEKIKFFAENGGIFALATGRNKCAVSSVEERISDISKAVFLNGGMIYDYEEEKTVYDATLPKEDYNLIYGIKEHFPEIGIEIHLGSDIAVYNRTPETDDHEFYEGMPTVVFTKEQVENIKINKALYTLYDRKNGEKIKQFIAGMPHSSRFVDTSAEFAGRERPYLEQIPFGISKADGVKKLAEILKIKRGNLFAIGDYYNDLEMLKSADISAAPCGSPKEIKDAVDYITRDVENGSVADFIDYLIKLRRK